MENELTVMETNEDIEKAILEKLNISDTKTPESEPQPVQSHAAPKRYTKQQIINDIMKMEKENGREVSEKDLKKMRKDELEAMLGKSVNTKLNTIIQGPQTVDSNVAVSSLSNLNTLVVFMLEETSKSFKDKTAGVALLEGWTTKVKSMKEELDAVFKAIIEKYGNSMQQYLDPFIQYTMIMSGSAGLVISENYQKKKQKLEDA